MLILAGVTIAALSGDNGILNKATTAQERTEQAGDQELRRLTSLEATTNLENQLYTDENGNTATIPVGFAVSQVEGENIIADGLVIIDSIGNEFVWVPVSQENFEIEFAREPGYSNGSIQTSIFETCGEADSTGNNTNSVIVESETTQKEAQKMYTSVRENHGFYIGRYEAGKEEGKVVVKKGVEVYNNVTWSKNRKMNEEEIVQGTEDNPDGAVELARNFDTANGYTAVTSTLIYGVQWDAIMKWTKDIENPNVSGKTFIQDSTGMGFYNGSAPIMTGINETYEVNNIYDLAGNVYEWTMESYGTSYRSLRGGGYDYTGFGSPVSSRFNGSQYNTYDTRGFRIALYL